MTHQGDGLNYWGKVNTYANIKDQIDLQEQTEAKLDALDEESKTCSSKRRDQIRFEKDKIMKDFQMKSGDNVLGAFTSGVGQQRHLLVCDCTRNFQMKSEYKKLIVLFLFLLAFLIVSRVVIFKFRYPGYDFDHHFSFEAIVANLLFVGFISLLLFKYSKWFKDKDADKE